MPIRSRSGRKAPHADAEAPELDPAARDAANKAKAGSAKLRLALLRYGAKHGLPNLSPAQCLAALQLPAKGRKRSGAAGGLEAGGKGSARGAAISREGRRDGTRG
jgi:hypothetical protein